MSDNKKKVFFIHYRADIDPSQPMTTSTSKYSSAKGGRTVAYVFDDNGVEFAIAKVNPGDVYNKSIGREVSSKRLAEGGSDVGYWPGDVQSFRAALDASLFAAHMRRMRK